MRLYSNGYDSGYDELIAHYPRYYRNVVEMVAILKAQGKLIDGLEDNIEQTYLNSFILHADEPTIAQWEAILNITYANKLTLDQRKRVVIGFLGGSKHIGEPEIREAISNYSDKTVHVDFGRGVIYIFIDGDIFDEGNLLKTLKRRIPAHLGLEIELHTVRTFRLALNIGLGGAVGAASAPHYASEDRMASAPLFLAQGAYSSPTLGSKPPDTKRPVKAGCVGAGGIYSHTHIKSKSMG